MGKSNGHFQRKDGWIPPVIDGRNETVMSILKHMKAGRSL